MNTPPSSRAPAPGMVIAGRFRLLRMLGQGGMGSVWAAHHTSLDSEVAIKFIDPDIADRAEILSRFSQEAMAAAKIKSPHVVGIFDHGVDESGRPFIAMELLKGEDLAARVERMGTLPLAEAGEIIRQAAKGLSRAHSVGVVHRDLKPENIFLVDEDDGGFLVKILDFGIAKSQNQMGPNSAGHKTATGQLIGTPMYMSPEQALGRVLDPRSDLYSLAVVAYRCVAGRPPFVYDAIGELIVAVSTLRAPPPSTFNADLPAEVDNWFERALQKDPGARFPSAKALGETFAAVCGGQPMPSSSGLAAVDSRPSMTDEALVGEKVASAPTVQVAAGAQPPSATSARTPNQGFVALDAEPKSSGNVGKLAVAALVVAAIGGGAFAVMKRDETPVVVQPGIHTSSSASPPAERVVAVNVAANPPSASIFWDGQPLGQNPFSGSRTADGQFHKVRAEAAGYEAVEQFVRADAPIELTLALKPINAALIVGAAPSAATTTPAINGHGGRTRPTVATSPASAAPASAAPITPPPPASATPEDPSKKPKTGVSLDKDDPWKK